MNTVILKEFGPIISDRATGNEIYQMIKRFHPDSNIVYVDMKNIISMTTFCAKQVFGKLYIELKPESFYSNIRIENANEDIKLVIKLGISSAVNEIGTHDGLCHCNS